jgi:hypothetical protein
VRVQIFVHQKIPARVRVSGHRAWPSRVRYSSPVFLASPALAALASTLSAPRRVAAVTAQDTRSWAAQQRKTAWTQEHLFRPRSPHGCRSDVHAALLAGQALELLRCHPFVFRHKKSSIAQRIWRSATYCCPSGHIALPPLPVKAGWRGRRILEPDRDRDP